MSEKQCVTHHYTCDCREAAHKEEVERLHAFVGELAKHYMKVALYLAARFPHRADELMDERLCGLAHTAMKEKLSIARAKGRGGWWDEKRCDIEYLRRLLREHIDKGDMVDVMNLAAMVYVRECVGS